MFGRGVNFKVADKFDNVKTADGLLGMEGKVKIEKHPTRLCIILYTVCFYVFNLKNDFTYHQTKSRIEISFTLL